MAASPQTCRLGRRAIDPRLAPWPANILSIQIHGKNAEVPRASSFGGKNIFSFSRHRDTWTCVLPLLARCGFQAADGSAAFAEPPADAALDGAAPALVRQSPSGRLFFFARRCFGYAAATSRIW